MNSYPKVKSVTIGAKKTIIVLFDNGISKIYDLKPLLDLDHFTALQNEGLFKTVKVDQGGHGISWNDQVDLSEAELWKNGLPT